MSSERKIRSARANGAQSRGPKTPEGRARSALNATTHGLTASTIVLANESQEAFRSLQQSYFDQFQPQNQLEADLLHQLIVARWRLVRIWAIETALLNLEMMKQQDEIQRDFESIADETRIALAFRALADTSSALSLLNRYESRFRRTFDRVLETFRRLRAAPPAPNQNLPNEPNPGTGRSGGGADDRLPSSAGATETFPGPAPPQTGEAAVLGQPVQADAGFQPPGSRAARGVPQFGSGGAAKTAVSSSGRRCVARSQRGFVQCSGGLRKPRWGNPCGLFTQRAWRFMMTRPIMAR